MAFFAVCALTVTLAAPAAAQTLTPGTWTGTIAPPGSEPVDVTYDVVLEGDSLTIAINAPPGARPFHDIQVSDGELKFWFEPGTAVDCVLARQDDGSYAGDCVAEDGSAGQLTMVPPKEE
jgi:hypothetical protein